MTAMAKDRVRKHTAPEVNRRIDDHLAAQVHLYADADRDEITRRLEELDREWDMERLLQTNASSLALTGTLLGILVHRKWLALPVFVTGFLLLHALQGWCPPVPLLRRIGLRTCPEIERERYALKLLRGDFESVTNGEQRDPDRLLQAINQ